MRVSTMIRKQIEKCAKSLIKEGYSVQINEGLPYVGVDDPNGESLYFVQEEQAQELLNQVPSNIEDKHYILWILDSSGILV